MMLAPLLLLMAAQKPVVRPLGPVDLPLTDSSLSGLDGDAARYGLRPLRTTPMPSGDLEVRVWHGFAWGTGLVVLRRGGDAWRVDRTAYRRRRGEKSPSFGLDSVPPPKRGWADVWRELDARGLRTIPNEASLPDDGVGIEDGVSYLFEIRTGPAYRAYFYDNPEDHPKKRYAPTVAKIVRVIARAMPDGLLRPLDPPRTSPR